MPGEESEIELRPFYEIEDFGSAVTPEVRNRIARQEAELAKRQGK